MGSDTFEYLIADPYNVAGSSADTSATVPAGFEIRTIPSFTWAVFPCKGEMPHALQDVNKSKLYCRSIEKNVPFRIHKSSKKDSKRHIFMYRYCKTLILTFNNIFLTKRDSTETIFLHRYSPHMQPTVPDTKNTLSAISPRAQTQNNPQPHCRP